MSEKSSDQNPGQSLGRAFRECRNTQLIFMARTIQKMYGDDALDVLLAHNREKTRAAGRDRAQDVERPTPDQLFFLFSEECHEFEVVEKTESRLEVIVHKCANVDVFKSFNAADLGEKLICSGDFAFVAGYNPAITLRRPCTCMTGDSCHFIFELGDEESR